jgi:hypothetical protein
MALLEYDIIAFVPRQSSANPPPKRVVVRNADLVPNYTFFKLSKPISITIIDLAVLATITISALEFFDWSILLAAAVGWIAVRESTNALLRRFLRHRRMLSN